MDDKAEAEKVAKERLLQAVEGAHGALKPPKEAPKPEPEKPEAK